MVFAAIAAVWLVGKVLEVTADGIEATQEEAAMAWFEGGWGKSSYLVQHKGELLIASSRSEAYSLELAAEHGLSLPLSPLPSLPPSVHLERLQKALQDRGRFMQI